MENYIPKIAKVPAEPKNNTCNLEYLFAELQTKDGRDIVDGLLNELNTNEGRSRVEDLLSELNTNEGRSRVEDLLSQLHSIEGRALALFFLIDKGIIKDNQYRHLEIYKEAKKIYIAAKVAEEEGKFEEAIGLYISANHYGEAASLEEKMGNSDKAIELYEKDESFSWAASLEEKRGNSDKAIELYEKDLFFGPMIILINRKDKYADIILYKKIDTLLMLDEVFANLVY